MSKQQKTAAPKIAEKKEPKEPLIERLKKKKLLTCTAVLGIIMILATLALQLTVAKGPEFEIEGKTYSILAGEQLPQEDESALSQWGLQAQDGSLIYSRLCWGCGAVLLNMDGQDYLLEQIDMATIWAAGSSDIACAHGTDLPSAPLDSQLLAEIQLEAFRSKEMKKNIGPMYMLGILLVLVVMYLAFAADTQRKTGLLGVAERFGEVSKVLIHALAVLMCGVLIVSYGLLLYDALACGSPAGWTSWL